MTNQGSVPSFGQHADWLSPSTAQPSPSTAQPSPSTAQVAFDTSLAHPARVYDYWLGGKDNFAADRIAAERVIEADPTVLPGVRANRAFLHRAVRYLAAEAGIRQFLDLGTGLPTAQNTHEVAQSIAPECRVLYMDNDPIVLVHAKALLTSTADGTTNYVQADARDTAKILAAATETLDLNQPVALMALTVMHYIPDSDAPHQVIAQLMGGLPSGSYLTLSDTTRDINTPRVSTATSRLNQHMGPTQLTLRTREEFTRFFDGLELVDPGVVPLPQWRPDTAEAADTEIPLLAGMGRKP